ncbi:hypothetical protein TraAM80_01166 [Trypanosoma rangeli]|uniref:Uncharacterized protein n=1 Tax=Trypanosoma rangeli TaxID=5698 RepID=A0A3R7KPI2_TRYRA|nr:uncharacterized protein TraAM80_01166 [Trypanosoma rangeli]RNF11039.1 hypothetical protein TraAM80_01166 [Trypanosoma rangeli]|eukprot:RNF11039.1 hypothetical protein TraAM80_01166 [Trypanosoma rangeli]
MVPWCELALPSRALSGPVWDRLYVILEISANARIHSVFSCSAALVPLGAMEPSNGFVPYMTETKSSTFCRTPTVAAPFSAPSGTLAPGLPLVVPSYVPANGKMSVLHVTVVLLLPVPLGLVLPRCTAFVSNPRFHTDFGSWSNAMDAKPPQFISSTNTHGVQITTNKKNVKSAGKKKHATVPQCTLLLHTHTHFQRARPRAMPVWQREQERRRRDK